MFFNLYKWYQIAQLTINAAQDKCCFFLVLRVQNSVFQTLLNILALVFAGNDSI